MSQPDSRANTYLQKPRANIYTMMLILSLVAIFFGCLFLWLEIREYQQDFPPAAAPAAAGAPAAWLPVIGSPDGSAVSRHV